MEGGKKGERKRDARDKSHMVEGGMERQGSEVLKITVTGYL